MWKRVFSKEYSNISQEVLWKRLTDINSWPTWHAGLEYCHFSGPFEAGNHFVLKPKGMGPVTITLTDVNAPHSFTDCTPFFGAKMYDTHTIEQVPNGVRIVNTLVVTGPLKWLWVFLVARKVAGTIETKTDALIALARGTHE